MASKSKDETPVKAPETPKKTPAPASAGSTLEKRVSFIERKLEKILGFDFNKDGKLGFVNPRLLTAMIVLALGITTVIYASNILNYPTPSGGTGLTLDSSGNLTVGGDISVSDDLTVTDDATVTDDLTVSGFVINPPDSLTITTNAYAITPTSSFMLLEVAQTTTNTVANPTAAGQMLTLVLFGGTTNCVFADSGNLELGSAVTLGNAGDSLTLIARSTSKWSKLSTSDN